MHAVTLRHNFETGHRLPHLKGRCESLHGHSWWAEVTIESPELAAGTVVEFGAYKKALRGWIDTHLDHGLMLGVDDPLAAMLAPHGTVYVFGDRTEPNLAQDLPWPTVEHVAVLLARVAALLLLDLVRAPGAEVVRVDVSETHVNRASWRL